jgi:hypothetical protein
MFVITGSGIGGAGSGVEDRAARPNPMAAMATGITAMDRLRHGRIRFGGRYMRCGCNGNGRSLSMDLAFDLSFVVSGIKE